MPIVEDTDASRESRIAVRHLLMQQWDPIGVKNEPKAQDEYDAYVGKICDMLMDEAAPAEVLANYLYRIESEHMGLTRDEDVRRDLCCRVAEELITLRKEFGASAHRLH